MSETQLYKIISTGYSHSRPAPDPAKNFWDVLDDLVNKIPTIPAIW